MQKLGISLSMSLNLSCFILFESQYMKEQNLSDKQYVIHPHYILITLVLFGVSALFIGFSGAYLYSRIQQNLPPVVLPPLFYYNSLILLASSYCLWKTKKAYREDNTRNYQSMLSLALFFSLVFLIAQIFAWNQLYNMNVSLQSSTLASYMYLITWVHFLHIIAGLPFLIMFIWTAYTKMRTPVTVLIYFSDDDKRRKLDLLNIYWHFVDALWIYLVLFFLINLLIK